MIDIENLKKNNVLVVHDIKYSSNTATNITPDLALVLDRIADFLTKNRQLTLEIGEHTETMTLDDARAKHISTERADNVFKYLVSQGVNAKRISATGFGRSQPLKDCRNGNCKPEEDEENRRLDIKINGAL